MPPRKKEPQDPAVSGYLARIGKKGGRKRQAQMTEEERAQFARAGAAARAAKLTPKKRSEIARKAALARYAKK